MPAEDGAKPAEDGQTPLQPLPQEPQPMPFTSAIASPGLEPSLQPRIGGPQFNILLPFQGASPVQPEALTGKLTEEHITQALKFTDNKEARVHEERVLSQKLLAGSPLIAFIFILALCWLFLAYSKPELIEKTLPLIIAFASGAFGGFGVGRWTGSKPKSE